VPKKLFEYKGPKGLTITLTETTNMYLVRRADKKGLFDHKIDSFTFGRLSHAITKYYDMISVHIEHQYGKAQEGGN